MVKTYKEAGVDIQAADKFVDKIKNLVGRHSDPRVVSGIGGFGALYDMQDGRYLVAGADGVGSKLVLAHQMKYYRGLGQDLLAMNVNDIICSGAKPLFFMDYLALGKLTPARDEEIIAGIVEACNKAQVSLIGGETAEMPSVYGEEDFDMAGFVVGEVRKEDLIDGKKCKEGDTIIGIHSSGPHSNGFGLLRKLFKLEETQWNKLALRPTALYPTIVKKLQENSSCGLKGLAHITGSGVLNIPRINEHFDYHITNWPKWDELSPIFCEIQKRMDNNSQESLTTFNMGIGMVVVTDQPQNAINTIHEQGLKSSIIGHVKKGTGEVFIDTEQFGRFQVSS